MSEGDVATIWVDVSHHDWNRRGGNLDWPAVLAATSPIMCARATYGDPSGYHPASFHFADFQAGARNAGFTCRGGYHNLIHGDSASMMRQADWLSRELDAQGCTWGMADVERYTELVSNGLWPRWDDVLRFRDAWFAVPRPALAWYIPQWLINGYYGAVRLADLPGLWIQSHYLTGVYGTPRQIYDAGGGNAGTGWDDTTGGRNPDVWQFSATCDCPGASNETDVNAYRGTLEQTVAALTGGGQDMTPEEHQMLVALFNDRQVAAWQYKNADGVADWAKNKPGVWYPDMHAVVWGTHNMVEALAANALSTEQLEAIREAARTGAASAAADLKAAVAQALAEDTDLTEDQAEAAAERAVRKVLGSVDDAGEKQ